MSKQRWRAYTVMVLSTVRRHVRLTPHLSSPARRASSNTSRVTPHAPSQTGCCLLLSTVPPSSASPLAIVAALSLATAVQPSRSRRKDCHSRFPSLRTRCRLLSPAAVVVAPYRQLISPDVKYLALLTTPSPLHCFNSSLPAIASHATHCSGHVSQTAQEGRRSQ